MALTRMPCSAYSIAAAFVNPITAAFEPMYALENGIAALAPAEAVLMIAPIFVLASLLTHVSSHRKRL